MSTLHEKLTNLSEKQDGLVQNKVAKFCYTDRAYTNDLVDSEPDFDINRDNNIPTPDPTTLRVNETILSRGWRAQASSITRMLMNHFLGRMSYNLNKVNDNMKTLLTTFDESLGTADGIATLDENGRIPYSQLPESAMEYKGSWDASTNTPHLANGTGTNGDFYVCSVAGSVDFGSGSIDFNPNDRVIYDGSQWQKLSSGAVVTVNGVSPVNGDVTLMTLEGDVLTITIAE